MAKRQKLSGTTRSKSDVVQKKGRQVFEGLVFCMFALWLIWSLSDLLSDFLPNDNLGTRKLLVLRCQEAGAEWIREWSSSRITHVIIDKSLALCDLLKRLGAESLPVSYKWRMLSAKDPDPLQPQIKVVNSAYPSACLEFGTLLDPKQSRFVVKGSEPTVSKPSPSSTTEESQNSSLPLKPTRKEAQELAATTPEMSQKEHVSETSLEKTPTADLPSQDPAQGLVQHEPTPPAYGDELDSTIKELQDVGDLVRFALSQPLPS